MERPQPVTYQRAAELLGRPQSTIRTWAERYHVRRLCVIGRRVYLDYRDLATIEACLYRGDPVPPTPEERDALRAARRRTAA